MTTRELAMLLNMNSILFPTPKTWDEVRETWRRTDPGTRAEWDRRAKRMMKVYAEKESEERR